MAASNHFRRSFFTAKLKLAQGFTLVELIIGMVVLAITMTIITNLLAPQARQSADPLVQIRATALGQALMNEILAKSFDQQSQRGAPWLRCGESGLVCTAQASFGKDCLDDSKTAPACTGSSLETRSTFNDVDDYHNLTLTSDADFAAFFDLPADYYRGFSLIVTVQYDDNYDGAGQQASKTAKLITIKITASNNEEYGFSAYRGNY
ncbi:prepilin-type N-terminal cleavage/methylation domain-containing protein [Pseudoalteromonas tunicata]|uniref:prepilin-type N-terminal cleavage/methylation domain-containing protein n=1 Tax=Pseudoalteromonas tunicata TaxID=314281 RepID=UPI00273E9189|nr:prepilin-type N-terminal cleavage/methylation domain-containing protein [Pseudoalteromonas tunicata]MDP5212766.1 prepilin-type N-terminal cleavage/methylation domain-containing protein [Pseudoalteromonas tunicata]